MLQQVYLKADCTFLVSCLSSGVPVIISQNVKLINFITSAILTAM